ncbi:MAG TPA: hypothetical protein VGO52_24235 [Hyphomonadaceae bacterium]|jgi:hypothetical protein|nr:hypothetical protein [Hyphomonadaceae bacterium]
MTGWTIAAAELRIPWGSTLAAHRMVVIADPGLNAVRQFNGLASWIDRPTQSWRCKPIGYLVSDRLRGYDTMSHPRTFMPINGITPTSRAIAPAIESGAVKVLAHNLSEADLRERLAPALQAIKHVNSLSPGPEGGAGLPYPFLGMGRNSNSFFSTLLHVMEFDEPAFARPARLVPGAGNLLLPSDILASLRRRSERRSA